MLLNILLKNVHIDKKLQNILLKKYSNQFKYLSKKKLNSFFFKALSINFPIKRKLYTVLASPHINKKAREQFNIVKHSKSLQLNLFKYYNLKIYNFLIIYKNYNINQLLKNYNNILYFKNTYNLKLVKFNNKNFNLSLKYKI